MREDELLALLAQGEGDSLEFKSGKVSPEKLAREIVAFANSRGGKILLGVEDNGDVSGWDKTEEWLMDAVIAKHVHPPIVPGYEELTVDGKRVGIASVPRGTAKPYCATHQSGGDRIYTRIGSTCHKASPEQIVRLVDITSPGHMEKLAVAGGDYRQDLNFQLVENYFKVVNKIKYEDAEELNILLQNRDLLVQPESRDELFGSCAAYALFAHTPQRHLPQAGIRLLVFRGTDVDEDAVLDEFLNVPFLGHKPKLAALPSLPDLVSNYLRPHISREKIYSDMRRRRNWDYPWDAIRELIVNAFAHRDWTRASQIRLAVYSDRLEITSPGALPNGMTPEKIKSGLLIPRNPNIVRILHDYGFVENYGMGIRRKVIPLMRKNNGCEPEFDATEDYFRVILPKAAKKKSGGGA